MGKPKITNTPWTPEEEEVITKMYSANASTQEIAEVLEFRTVDAVIHKAVKMGLKRPEPTINRELLEKYMKIHEC